MAKILLTQRRADLGNIGAAFAVVADGYEAPVGLPSVPLEVVLADAERLLDGSKTMVVVGLTRMMTPTNRVQLGRVFLRPRPGLTRICVDRTLFVGEPWRAWWMFRAVGEDAYFGLTDSFLAETRWNAAEELGTEDPFSWEHLSHAMRGVVLVDSDAFRIPCPVWVTVPTSDEVKAEYAAEKERAFTNEKTLPAIVRRLAAVAQRAVPSRYVPELSTLFRSKARMPAPPVKTDLAVDTFLANRLDSRITLTNAIANWGRA